jgi:hypothetical protein
MEKIELIYVLSTSTHQATMNTIMQRFDKLLSGYGLDNQFIDCLQSNNATVWGSAAVHCCLDRPQWDPNDLDILVSTQEEANNISNHLAEAGYDAGLRTTVRDTALMGYEENVRGAFADSIDGVIVHQQWRQGVVQLIYGLPPMEVHGRIRRVIKIYVGQKDVALTAADLDICQTHIAFADNGSIDIRDCTDGAAAKMVCSMFDLSTDDMSRLNKYRGRGFIITGDY